MVSERGGFDPCSVSNLDFWLGKLMSGSGLRFYFTWETGDLDCCFF